MADQYDSMSVGVLRKLLRERHPQTKGAFAANVRKELLLAILHKSVGSESTKFCNDAITTYFAGQISVAAPELDEGVAGDNPPDESDSGSKASNGDVEHGLEILKVADVAAYEKITAKLAKIEEYESLTMGSDKSTCAIPDKHGTVKIAGIKVPLMTPVDEEHHAIPAGDEHFRFDYWRSSRDCGAVKSDQSAEDVINLLMAGENIMLVGPPAVGKTSLIEQFANRCRWPMARINVNRDMTINDFVGQWEAQDGSTHFSYGDLPTGLRDGYLIILDELDHAPAEVTSILHAVLEPGGLLKITPKNSEIVVPHERVRFVATANTAGFGDDTGIHPNAQVQDAALLSRFDSVFHVAYMLPKNEVSLLVKRYGTPVEIARKMVEVANETRQAHDVSEEMMYPISLRQTQAWARLYNRFNGDLSNALTVAVLGKLPKNDVKCLTEICQRILGDKLDMKLAN